MIHPSRLLKKSLSLWERVRVRGPKDSINGNKSSFSFTAALASPLTPALSQREREFFSSLLEL